MYSTAARSLVVWPAIIAIFLFLILVIAGPRVMAAWYANEGNVYLIRYLTMQPREVVQGFAELPLPSDFSSRRALLSYTRSGV
jgi:hypothetical protein